MPTPNRGLPPALSVSIVLIALLVPPAAVAAAGARGLVRRTRWSGLEAQREVLVHVLLRDRGAGERDEGGHLVLDEVAHALALRDEPRQLDGGGRHARRVGD